MSLHNHTDSPEHLLFDKKAYVVYTLLDTTVGAFIEGFCAYARCIKIK